VRELKALVRLLGALIEMQQEVNRYGRMSKVGPAALRKALRFPAMVAVRYNPAIRAFSEKLSTKGKCKMEIIEAAIRKLAHIIYGVLKNNIHFCYQGA